ncbi:MAG: hypothetical protein WBQ44_12670 [Rhodococcus sp. (in: high G+C Gram-positive bacteria)]
MTNPDTATSPESTGRVGRKGPPLLLGGFAVAGVVLAVVFGFLWRSSAVDLAASQADERDRQIALNTASDYAARSLTYDYRNLDDFFAGVDEGASQALQDRYDGVQDALTTIMTESQVVATGEVLSAAVDSESGGEYKVTVFAQQTTQNIQQPDAGAVANLLAVTVTDQDGQWVVSDYGPKV